MEKIKVHGIKFISIDPITVGQDAPEVVLNDLAGQQHQLSQVTKPLLISVFPDIRTKTCSLQTQRFNVEAAAHQDIEFWSISNNTPEEQATWCAAHGVDMTILSDDGSFGEAFGLTMKIGPLVNRLARSIFVIKDGKVVYRQIVTEISDEPDYQAALAAITK
jgi:thioredoxin-dependent peroxiredoxin